MTDHMLIMHYEPEHGWSAPEIKPYGPLSIDPASSCLQYCPNVFEGMKVCSFTTSNDASFCWDVRNVGCHTFTLSGGEGTYVGSFSVGVIRP